ncbi:MAG: hypothetical protein J5545_11495 [Bacteroidaceae bacterium]|nr:hypothetical protein [Bacteroidaceae bacterium]
MQETTITNHLQGLRQPWKCQLPAAVRPFVAAMPQEFRRETLIAALTCYGVYMPRVRFNYVYDKREHVTVLQVVVLAPQSGNKSVIDYIVSRLVGRLRRRDKIFRREEEDWQENPMSEPNAKGQCFQRKRPLKPIITLGATMSLTQLVIRADVPERLWDEPLILFLYAEEVQELVNNNKKDFSNLGPAIRKGYDCGSTLDQDYVSSYSATPDLLLSHIVMGTQGGVDNFMNATELEQGGLTRKVLLRLPGDLADDAPLIRDFTPEEECTIDATISELMAQTYSRDEKSLLPVEHLDMKWMVSTVRRWCDDIRQEVKLSGSVALGTFYKRASVSAFRLTAILAKLYLMDRNRPANWQNICRRAYRYMAGYILDGLLTEWGGQFEAIVARQAKQHLGLQEPLFTICPETFTREWFNNLVAERGLAKGARQFLYTWKKSGWITESQEDGDTLYTKTEKGRLAHNRLMKRKGGDT